jgi:hypothetical protein
MDAVPITAKPFHQPLMPRMFAKLTAHHVLCDLLLDFQDELLGCVQLQRVTRQLKDLHMPQRLSGVTPTKGSCFIAAITIITPVHCLGLVEAKEIAILQRIAPF